MGTKRAAAALKRVSAAHTSGGARSSTKPSTSSPASRRGAVSRSARAFANKHGETECAHATRSARAEAHGSGSSNDDKPGRDGRVGWLTIVGARQNNLRNITVDVPLGRFVCITGVSGSGKSSLVNDIIRETLARDLNGADKVRPGAHDRIDGLEHLDKVIDIDQSPIGRTPRSNPATYIKVFDEIRALYARLPDSKVRGYKPGRFSFNVHTGSAGGGRCEACEGNGSNRMEMDFLADVWVTCPVCGGRRFARDTLQVHYKGKSIADVLEMDVQEALAHFGNVPRIAGMLQTLHDVGLDYIKLGQSSTTLSGGEAQRIKLARELVKRSTGRTLYLLDEPTTGLHFDDIKKLLTVLHGFVDAGNSVMVIEHNLDVIKTADWVIDLGPEGGDGGGKIVAAGTPEAVAKSRQSLTGQVLAEVLNGKATKHHRHGTRAAGLSPRERLSAAIGPSHDGKSRRLEPAAQTKRRDFLTVVGARQHNLKNITVDVPRGKMTVCCGPSGSGKSSLAVDTIYAEGQRRYVESLSAYARQFLSRLQPPSVEHVYGLSPAICIEQKNAAKSPRSTVGTVTEVYDYMRILWSRVGTPYCPMCKVPIGTQTSDEIVEKILALGEGQKVLLLAPVEPTGQESYGQLFKCERANGYARVRVDGAIHSLDDSLEIDHRRRHRVELVVDRVVIRRSQASRLSDSVEQALTVGEGVMIVQPAEDEDTGDTETPAREKLAPKRRTSNGERLTEENSAVVQSSTFSDGRDREMRFSQHHSCDRCGRSYEELSPHNFSFNSRLGWCDACEGLGIQKGATPSAIVVHPTLSIADGAVANWGTLRPGSKLRTLAEALARHVGFDLDSPWNRIPDTQQLAFLHGCGEEWIAVGAGSEGGAADAPEGVAEGSTADDLSGMRFQWHGFYPTINRATRSSWQYRKNLEELVTDVPCDACAGGRLRRDAAAVRLQDCTLHEVCLWPIGRALSWFEQLRLSARERKIAGELLLEITSRLRFLVDVGVDYLSLHRTASTLSGGESQRIQLAAQLGTGLTGVLYVLDEPTIGLHPRDNARLIKALRRLRDQGNTLLLVEHDREVIDSADHVLDFGPGAGALGGEITAAAPPKRLKTKQASLTGRYLSGKQAIEVPTNRRPVPAGTPRTDLADDDAQALDVAQAASAKSGKSTRRPRDAKLRPRIRGDAASGAIRWLIVHGARENNLKEIDVAFPLGRFTCVTGVSGSGKSSLVSSILYQALAARIHRARLVPGGHDRISGIEHIDKVINVDQSPIGNSPMSNPATYTGVFDAMRELFAKIPLSKVRGYSKNRFSFNRPGGRCEACEGMGQRCIEMHFLPDVWIDCENCKGRRYVEETLDVKYRGKSISDVLEMSVADAVELFANVPKVKRMLQTLDDVGLGYLRLGQSAPTLSAGEAQRVKLAAELGRPSTGKTLYILDEPTTGLHFDDLKKLLNVLHRLVDLGNTCVCIEHNLDVIKTTDWVIDLGPEAGELGGTIVAEGPPERIARTKESRTGAALGPVLAAGPAAHRPVHDPQRHKRLERDLAKPLDLGSDVRMPWESDGRAWHTVDHVDHRGAPTQWEPALLTWLVETVESIGRFAPADWNHRTRIEIKCPGDVPWFVHVLTGGRDLLELAMRVPEGTFDESELNVRLRIKELDDRPDLPIYGQWNRVRLRTPGAGWQEVRLYLRDFKDVNKRVFHSLINDAARAYLAEVDSARAAPGKGQPWKIDGQAWHLSQKSIHPGHAVRWKPALLLAVIGKLRSLQPDLRLSWDSKTAVTYYVPGESDSAGKIVTNMGRGLRVELRTPRGALTPALVDGLGEDAEIKRSANCDRVAFWLRSLEQMDSAQLREAWRLSRTAPRDERLQSA